MITTEGSLLSSSPPSAAAAKRTSMADVPPLRTTRRAGVVVGVAVTDAAVPLRTTVVSGCASSTPSPGTTETLRLPSVEKDTTCPARTSAPAHCQVTCRGPAVARRRTSRRSDTTTASSQLTRTMMTSANRRRRERRISRVLASPAALLFPSREWTTTSLASWNMLMSSLSVWTLPSTASSMSWCSSILVVVVGALASAVVVSVFGEVAASSSTYSSTRGPAEGAGRSGGVGAGGGMIMRGNLVEADKATASALLLLSMVVVVVLFANRRGDWGCCFVKDCWFVNDISPVNSQSLFVMLLYFNKVQKL
eukprot:PhM_4_TR8687/c0_g1_i1/m.50481